MSSLRQDKKTSAVLTVPAGFTDLAVTGLNVVKLINEPTAEILTYGRHKDFKEEKLVISMSLGGGHLGVSLLSVEEGIYEVKAMSRDTLGGQDLTQEVLEWRAGDFQKKFGVDVHKHPFARICLRLQCEKAMCTISTYAEATIEVKKLIAESNYSVVHTRKKFEELSLPILSRAVEHITRVLSNSRVAKDEIYGVVAMGGCVYVPNRPNSFKSLRKKPVIYELPEGASAIGAAVFAAIFTESELDDTLMLDAAAHSISMEITFEKRLVLIPKDQTIPCKKCSSFARHTQYSDPIIQVFEGEGQNNKDNNLLRKFQVSGFRSSPRGSLKVTLLANQNGILKITVRDSEIVDRSISFDVTSRKRNLSANKLKELGQKYSARCSK